MELYNLNDVYFDLGDTEIEIERMFSLLKFVKGSYEEIESYSSTDYYSLCMALGEKLVKVSESIANIRDKLEKINDDAILKTD